MKTQEESVRLGLDKEQFGALAHILSEMAEYLEHQMNEVEKGSFEEEDYYNFLTENQNLLSRFIADADYKDQDDYEEGYEAGVYIDLTPREARDLVWQLLMFVARSIPKGAADGQFEEFKAQNLSCAFL